MRRRVFAVGLAAVWACSETTSLAPLDVRAQQNQQRAALAILAHLKGTDAGAIESLAESIYCGAGGILRRAGDSAIDAGIPCP
jgi:hypothetical protein